MTKMIFAAVAVALLPAPAFAQNIPAAVVAVVDSNKAGSECTACKTAIAQLQQQQQALATFRQQLAAPLQTEAQALQTQADALKGKQPDAALKAKAAAFQQKQANAEQQFQVRAQAFERNRAYVNQQVSEKIDPAIKAVRARRGATIVLDASAVADFAPAVDVTADVVAELNRTLPSIITVAPAPAPQASQGR